MKNQKMTMRKINPDRVYVYAREYSYGIQLGRRLSDNAKARIVGRGYKTEDEAIIAKKGLEAMDKARMEMKTHK